MKVLYIIGGKGKKYGSEIIAMQLIEELSINYNVDYDVVVSSYGVITDFCEKLGINYYVVNLKWYVYKKSKNSLLNVLLRTMLYVRAELLTKCALIELEKKIDLSGYDIIHTNLSRDMLGAVISRKYNIPHIWYIQEMYDSHYGVSLLKNNQIEWMNKHTEKYIAISKTVANDWIRNKVEQEKVTVINNGINLNLIEKKKTLSYGNNDVLKIVMVGSICQAKGQYILLEAVSLLDKKFQNKIIVDLYGDGKNTYIDFILKEIERKKLQNIVRLKGFSDNIYSILKEYDIGINASKGEGFGLATIEYMVAGLCPIVSNTGANIEIIGHKINGLVFEYENYIDLKNCLQELINNKKMLLELSIKAQLDANEKYNNKKMCEDVYMTYKSLLKD